MCYTFASSVIDEAKGQVRNPILEFLKLAISFSLLCCFRRQISHRSDLPFRIYDRDIPSKGLSANRKISCDQTNDGPRIGSAEIKNAGQKVIIAFLRIEICCLPVNIWRVEYLLKSHVLMD